MTSLQPRAGVHYPRSAGEFRSWFATDADCLDYLDWLRWPDGFVCGRRRSSGDLLGGSRRGAFGGGRDDPGEVDHHVLAGIVLLAAADLLGLGQRGG